MGRGRSGRQSSVRDDGGRQGGGEIMEAGWGAGQGRGMPRPYGWFVWGGVTGRGWCGRVGSGGVGVISDG